MAAPTAACARCRKPFCPNCVVTLFGETLCGGCKTFAVRNLQRPTTDTRLDRAVQYAAIGTVLFGFVLQPTALWYAISVWRENRDDPQWANRTKCLLVIIWSSLMCVVHLGIMALRVVGAFS